MTVNDAVYRLPSGTASTSPLAAARVHRATPPPPHGPVGSASSGTDVPTSSQGEQALTPRRVPDQAVSEATGRHMDERAAAQRRAGAPAAGARPGASPLHCRGRTQHAHAAAAHARTRAAERWLCRVRRKSRCCSGWWPALRPNTCRAGLHSGVGSPGDEQILGRPRRRLQHSPRAAGAQAARQAASTSERLGVSAGARALGQLCGAALMARLCCGVGEVPRGGRLRGVREVAALKW